MVVGGALMGNTMAVEGALCAEGAILAEVCDLHHGSAAGAAALAVLLSGIVTWTNWAVCDAPLGPACLVAMVAWLRGAGTKSRLAGTWWAWLEGVLDTLKVVSACISSVWLLKGIRKLATSNSLGVDTLEVDDAFISAIWQHSNHSVSW